MTQEDEGDFDNNNSCRFCEKNKKSDKIRDHCHLTSRNGGPAHNNCNINVKQNDSTFIPFAFHNFCITIVICFLKKLADLKTDKVKIKIIAKTSAKYTSVT